MKKYTQKNFDSIQRDEYGYKHLRPGDWSAVDFRSEDKLIFAECCTLGNRCRLGDRCKLGDCCELGDYCKLGDSCELGDGCTLGDCCRLGNRCRLGNCCTLGECCTLGTWCKLGDGCTLGDCCRLGNRCRLGNWCTLGECCRLGGWCELGDKCTLGDRCKLENGCIRNATYFFVSNIGCENRTAYAYCDRDSGEIFIRAGCWFSGIEDFIQRVKDVHHGTQHETDYLAFAAFAKARFAQYQKGG